MSFVDAFDRFMSQLGSVHIGDDFDVKFDIAKLAKQWSSKCLGSDGSAVGDKKSTAKYLGGFKLLGLIRLLVLLAGCGGVNVHGYPLCPVPYMGKLKWEYSTKTGGFVEKIINCGMMSKERGKQITINKTA